MQVDHPDDAIEHLLEMFETTAGIVLRNAGLDSSEQVPAGASTEAQAAVSVLNRIQVIRQHREQQNIDDAIIEAVGLGMYAEVLNPQGRYKIVEVRKKNLGKGRDSAFGGANGRANAVDDWCRLYPVVLKELGRPKLEVLCRTIAARSTFKDQRPSRRGKDFHHTYIRDSLKERGVISR